MDESITGLGLRWLTRLASPEDDFNAASLIGSQVGNHVIAELIAESFFSWVFLARHCDADIEQVVIIKVLRHTGGQGGERGYLSKLLHPNVVRIYDAGRLPSGHHYLVMERIEGLPLCDHVRQYSLTLRGVIELFRQLGAGLAAAHTRLILHMDIKPANVMVTATGVIKLIDFGVSRPLDDTTANDNATNDNGWLGFTPEFVAPETRDDGEYSIASDIYQLGVTMAIAADSCRIARNERHLRETLSAIIARCRHDDPARRYASVAQLDDDLHALLLDRPTSVDTTSRKLSKWFKRNRRYLAVAAVLVLSSVGAAARYLIDMHEQRVQLTQALEAQTAVNEVLSYFLSEGKQHLLTRDILYRDYIDKVTQTLQFPASLTDNDRKRILGLLAQTFYELSAYREGLNVIERFESVSHTQMSDTQTPNTQTPTVDSRESWSLYFTYAMLQEGIGNLDGVEHTLRVLETQSRWADAEQIIRMLDFKAGLLRKRGRPDESLAVFERLVPLVEQTHGDSEPLLRGTIYNNIAGTHMALGHFAEARHFLLLALEDILLEFGGESRKSLLIAGNIAYTEIAQGMPEQAAQRMEASIGQLRQNFPQEERLLASHRVNLGIALRDLGRFREAELHLRDALESYTHLFGADSHRLISPTIELAELHGISGACDLRAEYLRRAQDLANRHYGDDQHQNVIRLRRALDDCSERLHDLII